MARKTHLPFSKRTPSQRCPDCDQSIEFDAMNIQEGVALCPDCGKLSRLSELNDSDRSVEEILAQPPSGCSIIDRGHGVVVSASLRSASHFLFSALFALFWNGIVSLFVLIAIAGLYSNLVGPVPDWFPAAGVKDGKPEMNGEPMNLGSTLFLCLFLIPFVIIGFGMTVCAITHLIAKVEVVIDEFDSYVATGFRFLNWKKRFNARHVHRVSFSNTKWQSEGSANRLIELTAERTVKFGSLLRDDRMVWLRAVLKEVLLRPAGKRQGTALPNLSWIPQNDQ